MMTDILIYAVLFFLLSPGLLLNIPGTTGLNFWKDASFFKPNAMGGYGLDTDAVLMTHKTSFWSIVGHTVVFLVLAFLVKKVLAKSEEQQKTQTA
jgi:hypothetical protein